MSQPDIAEIWKQDLWRHADVVSHEEARDLATRMNRGDKKARAALVTANLRLVAKIAGKFHRRNPDADFNDLLQEGHIGILIAADKYNAREGALFTTYATWWIEARMLDYVISRRSALRVGRSSHIQRKVIFGRRHCAGETPDEIAEELEVPAREVRSIMNAMAPAISIFGDESPIVDKLSDGDEGPEEGLARAELRAIVRERLATLPLSKREHEVIDNRLLAEEPMTLKAIGELWGVGRERVRQIEEILLDKIRAVLGDIANLTTSV